MTAPEAGTTTYPPLTAPPISLIALTPELADSAVKGRLNAAPGWPEPPFRALMAELSRLVAADPSVGALTRLITLPDSSNPQGWRVIGDVGVKFDAPRSDQEAEIGYSITRNFRGRGFGSRAVLIFCQYLLDQGYTALRARTEDGNDPSERVLEKIGFALVSRHDGLGDWIYRKR